VDPTTSALGIARRRAADAGVTIDWREGVGERLPFADDSFDRVVSSLAFHHIPVALKGNALAECRRVTRPGGRALLVDFGDSETLAGAVALRLFGLAGGIGDQIGRLGVLLREAGYTDVHKVGQVHLGIALYEGRRAAAHPSACLFGQSLSRFFPVGTSTGPRRCSACAEIVV
jgi:SAM-dependent methyltransferase